MLVKCSGITCINNKNGMCGAESIEMIDFDYFEDAEGKRKEEYEDKMVCSNYKYDFDYLKR